jgi:hypothetical protein
MAKSPIPVYAAEIEAGLAEAIAQQNSVAYVTQVLKSPEPLRAAFQAMAAAQASLSNEVTFDLYPVHTIMVTTGWNNNDDIFTKADTWAARYTPEDKPFNLGHKPREIIGHITANAVVDDSMTFVDDTLPFEEVPDKFHILTSAVIYRHLASKDETLQAEAAELIEQIEAGDWYVSMECLFGGFDYGVTYASGEHQVVSRNQKTAFLTKHLRIQGGCGEYNGGKLGRVLRNITFSGKGLVDKPANPESVILNDVTRFAGVVAVTEWPQAQAHNHESGEKNMAENDKYAAQLEETNRELQTSLANANKKIEELGEANVKAALAEKDGQIDQLTKDLEATKAKVDELTESFNKATAAKEEADAAKAEVDEKLAEATAKLAEAAAVAKTNERIATLVDKKVDKAIAETVVAEFADLDDEKFTKVVEMQAQIAEASAEKSEGEEKPAEDSAAAGDNANNDDPENDPEGEAAAGDADLENAQADQDPNMGSDDSASDKDKEQMQALASFLDTAMHGDTAGE